MHTSLTFQTTYFKAAISENKGDSHCEGYDYEQDPEDIANSLPEDFFYKKIETAE